MLSFKFQVSIACEENIFKPEKKREHFSCPKDNIHISGCAASLSVTLLCLINLNFSTVKSAKSLNGMVNILVMYEKCTVIMKKPVLILQYKTLCKDSGLYLKPLKKSRSFSLMQNFCYTLYYWITRCLACYQWLQPEAATGVGL